MQSIYGCSYHWLPDLYKRLKLPVYEGVKEALEKYSVQRKKTLDSLKTERQKKRTVQRKVERTRGTASKVAVKEAWS